MTKKQNDWLYNNIHCANCLNCKVFIIDNYARVKCIAGLWRKKNGETKYYKYFSILRRVRSSCVDYKSMGNNLKDYLDDLESKLPVKDEPIKINNLLIIGGK